MNARTVSQSLRPVWRSTRGLSMRAPLFQQRRLISSEQEQKPSPVKDFYKTFTRPVLKVVLMAIFTYQLAYWGWVKLETDEIKAEREEEIKTLEGKVSSLKESLQHRKPDDSPAAGGQVAAAGAKEKKKSSWWPW